MTSRVNGGNLGSSELIQLVSSWWYHYDEWKPEALRTLVADDFRFKCRSDTGTTAYEDFIRIDTTGVDEAIEWHAEHRFNSPYPLRSNCSNIVITADSGNDIEFSSYIFVTKIVDGRPYAVSSGIAHGAARWNEGKLLLASLEVVLDTMESIAYSDYSKNAT
ncbi:hypothetical protein ACFWPH_32700 [Nocardia sp. NPDC058499]|uniref:hypothetical protein n=1 Tax=Nocardia sp. NPDC058499 TaxID=3346530 RepID=UPI0036534935